MSDRELITEYKHTILELTQEKKDLNKLIEEKDAKIKSIVLSSSMSSLLFSMSEYPWFNSSTKNLYLFKNM